MRLRSWTLLGLAMMLLAVAGCASLRGGRAVVNTPVPTKTLRPTFTHTPPQTKAVPTIVQPVAAAPQQAQPPAPTAAPPPPPPTPIPPPTQPPPSPTPEKPGFTVSAPGTTNVRAGPGTNYAILGEVRQGQQFEITGKNPAGTWWEFDFNGRRAWIIADRVSANAAARGVAVAANIPAPPTARPAAPRPTSPPAAPPPPPAPSYPFRVADVTPRINTNPNYITVWCKVQNRSNDFIEGVLRVTGPSGSKDQPFRGVMNWGSSGTDESKYQYNDGCKIEFMPYAEGTHTAFLVSGGQQISDPINFNVSGETREFILAWREK